MRWRILDRYALIAIKDLLNDEVVTFDRPSHFIARNSATAPVPAARLGVSIAQIGPSLASEQNGKSGQDTGRNDF